MAEPLGLRSLMAASLFLKDGFTEAADAQPADVTLFTT
jgi:hypothetical protein